MKVVFLAPGLAAVKRGTERFELELAAALRQGGLDASCWGTTEGPGVEALPVPAQIDLQEFVLGRLRADPRYTNLSTSALHDWPIHTADQLFSIPAFLRIKEMLAQGEQILVYVKWQGGLVDPGGDTTPLLKLLNSASQSGKARLVVYTDWVYPPICSYLSSADAVFHAIGPWITEQLLRMGVNQSNILELPMCITASNYRDCGAKRAEMRRELGIPDDAFVILSVGAFDTTNPDKRHDYTLREILSLPAVKRIWWVVAGSRGPEPCAWEQEARKRLGARFVPLTNVPFEKMPQLYGMADLFVLASLRETFGLVYIEAQAAGLPVVIHDCEVTRHLCRGLLEGHRAISLVNMEQKGAAAAAISQWVSLLSDKTRIANIRTRLHSFAQAQTERFGWESVGPRFAKAFSELLRTSPSPQAAPRPRVQTTWDEQAYQIGLRRFSEGKFQEALESVAIALGGQENSERWNDWAAMQVQLNRPLEAEQGYRRALDLNPHYAQAKVNLGALLAHTGRPGEASSLLEESAAALDAKQQAGALKMLDECRQKKQAERYQDPASLAEYLRKFGELDGNQEGVLRENLAYYAAVLNAVPAAVPGKKLLGTGPGFRYLAPVLAGLKGYTELCWCVDSARRATETASSRRGEAEERVSFGVEYFNLQQDQWPYEADCFDLVLVTETLEKLAFDPMMALSEINRVLKRGGQLVLTAPNVASVKSLHCLLRVEPPYIDGKFRPDGGRGPHHREYTPGEIDCLARAAGFNVTQLRTPDLYWDPPRETLPSLVSRGYHIGPRGDTILLMAQKEAPVKDRYPAKLYDLSRVEEGRSARAVAATPSTEVLEDGEAGSLLTPNLPVPGEVSSMRVLVVHENPLQPDKSGCDYRLLQVLRELLRQGHSVTYLAARGLEKEKYVPRLVEMGIKVYSEDAQVLRREGVDHRPEWTLQEVLREGQFDVALIFLWFWCCTSLPEHYIDEVRRLSPRTRIAILSDDCHGFREMRGANLSGKWSDRERAEDYREREADIYRRADIVLAISEEDRQRLSEDSPGVQIDLLPMIVEPGLTGPDFDAREGLMFLADYRNPANRDGIEWFFKQVWPSVLKSVPGVKLHLVGSNLPRDFASEHEGTVGVGFVPDLETELAKRRMLVAPVRWGTGVKTKNLLALSHGLPVVTTTVGAEGLDLRPGQDALIADTAEDFARAIVRLYTDAACWRSLAAQGRSHILQKFSQERLGLQISRMLNRARLVQPQPYDPAHVWSVRLVEKYYPEVLNHLPAHERFGVRVLAYSLLAERFLSHGDAEAARRQLRHVFSYVPNRVPFAAFFAGFRSVVERMERVYLSLGATDAARYFRREARHFEHYHSSDSPPAPPPSPAPSKPVESRRTKRNREGERPNISVIIPTYNRRETLRKCLDALNRQSLSSGDFEVVVVDDGSSDGTEECCRSVNARYSLSCVRQKNSGAGAARRLGVERARGEYLVLFNDDTISSPELLGEHLRVHEAERQQKVAVLGDFRYPDEARARALTHFLSTQPFLFPQVSLDPGLHSKNAYFIASNLSVRRDAVLAAGSFDPRFRVAEDTELGVRLRATGYQVLYHPKALAVHDHLQMTSADLVRRAEIYGQTQLLLFRKHPHLLGDGTGPFGRLDESAIERIRDSVERQRKDIPTGLQLLEKLDHLDLTPYFHATNGERGAADQIMNAVARVVPVVFWFFLHQGFLAAWNEENNQSEHHAHPSPLDDSPRRGSHSGSMPEERPTAGG